MRMIEELRVGEVILTEVDGDDMPAIITSIDGDNESIKVNIVGTAIKSELYMDQVFKIGRKPNPWNKSNTFPIKDQKIDDPNNGYQLNQMYLVKVGSNLNYHYYLARYTEWGWHYATHNTESIIFDVMEWREIQI